MSDDTRHSHDRRTLLRRRALATTGAALLLVAVSAAGVLWFQSWSERGWLGYAFQGQVIDDEDREKLGPLVDVWFMHWQNYQVIYVHPGSPAGRAGLSRRDRVVAIGGVPVEESAELAELDARLRSGDEVTVEVIRDGVPRSLRLAFESPFASPTTLATSLVSVAVALLFLIPGLVVYWARPRSPLAGVFTLLSAAGTVLFFLFAFADLALVSPRGLLALDEGGFNFGFYACVVLTSFVLSNLIVHLALIFPRPRPIVERWPKVLHWVHAAPLALVGSIAALVAGMASSLSAALQLAVALAAAAWIAAVVVRLRRARLRSGRPLVDTLARRPYLSLSVPLAAALLAGTLIELLPDRLAFLLFLVSFLTLCLATAILYPLTYAVVVLVSMVRSYRESGVEEKRQVRWPMWGVAVCMVSTALLSILSLALPQLVPELLESITWHTALSLAQRVIYLAIPISFAFAIAKYRLMEIDLLVRKTVVYAATTMFVVGAYFVVVGLLGVALVSYIDVESPLLAVGATLLVVALFVPVRNRVQRLVDRRFRRDGTDRREAIESIRRDVLAAGDLETLLPRIAETTQQALQSRALVLFVRPHDRDLLLARAKVGVPDELVGHLRVPATAFAGSGRVVDRDDLPFDDDTREQLKRRRLHCFAPARRQGEVVGAVAVADSLSGDETSADDREFLSAAADQLALAVATLGLRRESVELDQARLLQRSLLPAELPRAPGVDLAGAWHPAREVAGDYYEAIDFGDGKLALCIGDVVGKGMPAALLMSSLQAAVRAVARADTPPSRLCEQVRRVVTSNLTGGRFVTFFYALYDAAERRLVYANAGHVPPLLVRADGGSERLEAGGGAFARLLAESPFENGETTLAAGDRLVLFTDGVSEAMSPDGALYGEDRLAALVASIDGASAAALAERITADVRRHAAGDPADDLTLLLLRAT